MLGKLVVGEIAVGEIVLGKLRWGNDLRPTKQSSKDMTKKVFFTTKKGQKNKKYATILKHKL